MRPQHPARTLVLLFLIMILLGGMVLRLPICAQEGVPEWSTAYFTATSAACVTGLAVVDTATYWSPVGQVVILVLIQLGGLGYMLASTMLIVLFRRQPDLHSRLLLRETLGEVTLSDTLRLLRGAVAFTFTVEAVGALILLVRFAQEPGREPGEAAWWAVFTSISAFCNAGFDLFGRDYGPFGSLAGYRADWVVNLTVMALIIIGGLGFAVCLELLRFRPRRLLSLHTRLVLGATGALILFGFLTILATEWTNRQTLGPMPLGEKVLVALFQSVTTRTAGFATVDFNHLRSITLMVMGVLMVIGASPAGTGGGIKTTTVAVTAAAVYASLRGHVEAEVFNRRIPIDVVFRALALIVLALAVLIAGTLILVFTEPAVIAAGGIRDNLFVRIQFEAMSAFATVGLSTGITPLLSEPGRLVIMVLMFIGRVGTITLANAWTVPGPPPKRHYPEERVPLG